MGEQLKPCPFCGGEAQMGKLDVAKPYGNFQYGAGCVTFMCVGAARPIFLTEAQAITAWNARSEGPHPESGEAEKVIAGLCDNCSSYSVDLHRNADDEWICGPCRSEETFVPASPPPLEGAGPNADLIAELRLRLVMAKAGGADVIKFDVSDLEAVIAALSAAPVASKGEALPVAWRFKFSDKSWNYCTHREDCPEKVWLGGAIHDPEVEPLYARPSPGVSLTVARAAELKEIAAFFQRAASDNDDHAERFDEEAKDWAEHPDPMKRDRERGSRVNAEHARRSAADHRARAEAVLALLSRGEG